MVTMMKRTVRHEDALGRTVRVERGGFGDAALATAYDYDGFGRLVRVAATADGRGNVSRVEYDGFGRRSATVDAAGNATRYGYDAYGNLVAVTNALGGVTVYGYDLRGNRTYEGGATYPVRREYDVFGNVTSMATYRDEASGAGDVTRWAYDAATGAMTNKTYADGRGPSYEYDANGRLARRTWARGVETAYSYDGWGNLTNTAYSDGTPAVALSYDAMGRQVAAHDAAGVAIFAYDTFGANTNETVTGVAGSNIIERLYDAFGRDAGYALNGVRQSTLAYDPATGRLLTMLAAGCTNAFRWSYHPGSDLKHTLLYPNGALVTWEYEPHRDLITLVSNDVYSTFHYTYDDAGRRMSKNDEHYTYNIRGELILATNVVTGAEFVYRYDDIGNRLWFREFGTNCTYVANEQNQYTNIVRGGVFELSAFDLDGNQTNIVTSTGEWAVEYNGENRPVRWYHASDGTTVRMAYDRRGRRVLKNDETFVYDNYLNVSETIWDPTEPVATRPLVWTRGGNVAYYTHDGNKNVSEVVGSFDLKAHYDYTAFGGMFQGVGPLSVSNLWRVSSEYVDDDAMMTYYNFRHYSPDSGHWITRDPALETAAYSQMSVFNLLGSIEAHSQNPVGTPYYSLGQDYSYLDNRHQNVDFLGLVGRYDPPPTWKEIPFPPCCPSQRLDCYTYCVRRYVNYSKSLCDLNFVVVSRCRCLCRWDLVFSARSGFPGYTRNVDCTYGNSMGKTHTIGYYGVPTWFMCPSTSSWGVRENEGIVCPRL